MSSTVGAPSDAPPEAGEGAGQRMSAGVRVEGAPTFDDLIRRRYEPVGRGAVLLRAVLGSPVPWHAPSC